MVAFVDDGRFCGREVGPTLYVIMTELTVSFEHQRESPNFCAPKANRDAVNPQNAGLASAF
jgi:hypothetical protein